jgi:hypothetical protein
VTVAAATDVERLAAWRIETLLEAGYPADWAIILGERDDVDLRTAVFLLESDCDLKTAIRILA